MKNLQILYHALNYIEQNLNDVIKTEEVAAACFCSKSTLEKLFRRVNGISVHDYVIRRRMMLAAKEISQHPETAIVDVAVEYGYSTHESFARAFKQVWNCNPSEFRKKKFTELFPRLNVPPEEGFEKGIPHCYLDENDLFILLKDFKIVSMNQIRQYVRKGREAYGIHFFVHVAKEGGRGNKTV